MKIIGLSVIVVWAIFAVISIAMWVAGYNANGLAMATDNLQWAAINYLFFRRWIEQKEMGR